MKNTIELAIEAAAKRVSLMNAYEMEESMHSEEVSKRLTNELSGMQYILDAISQNTEKHYRFLFREDHIELGYNNSDGEWIKVN